VTGEDQTHIHTYAHTHTHTHTYTYTNQLLFGGITVQTIASTDTNGTHIELMPSDQIENSGVEESTVFVNRQIHSFQKSIPAAVVHCSAVSVHVQSVHDDEKESESEVYVCVHVCACTYVYVCVCMCR
jgi:hypothetical protein